MKLEHLLFGMAIKKRVCLNFANIDIIFSDATINRYIAVIDHLDTNLLCQSGQTSRKQ